MEILDWVLLKVAAVFQLIPGFIVTVFVIVFSLLTLILLARCISMLHYHTVRGRVIDVRVSHDGGEDHHHKVDATYEYFVNGKMYVRRTEDDSRISKLYDEDTANKRADALRRDRTIIVRFDPTNPASAVGGEPASMAFAIGVALLICAMVSLAFAIHIFGVIDLEPYVRLVESEIKSWWK